MTKITTKQRKIEGVYSLDSYEYYSYMLEPGYDWSKHSTKELLCILRSELGRESPDFHAKLKNVLATRPNIPTKQQAKAKRVEKAKAQRNR
jgi:hypothetical protein